MVRTIHITDPRPCGLDLGPFRVRLSDPFPTAKIHNFTIWDIKLVLFFTIYFFLIHKYRYNADSDWLSREGVSGYPQI